MKIVIGGASGFKDVPRLQRGVSGHEVYFAPDDSALREYLPLADIFVSWSFRRSGLEQHWPLATRLKWVHWCGAGVTPALFPALVQSNVVLTNARGIFDQAMAEYVLGMMLAFGLRLPSMLDEQRARRWTYRQSQLVLGTQAVIFGVGGIGQRIAEVLKAAGVRVIGVGRRARETTTVFGRVLGHGDRMAAIAAADWVITVMPDTPETKGYFGHPEFSAMKRGAHFINVGRGNCVDEASLLDALKEGRIAGAALDVFGLEPLPKNSPFWNAPGLLVTPHIAGDFQGFEDAMCEQFLDNLDRFTKEEALVNVVDKLAGYVVAA